MQVILQSQEWNACQIHLQACAHAQKSRSNSCKMQVQILPTNKVSREVDQIQECRH